MDRISKLRRSENMRRIKSKNTKPELTVRKAVRALGYGYRLHSKDLPGRPDLVFRGRRKVIFVHGCFWHRHENCRESSNPSSRQDYWQAKFKLNVERDIRNREKLEELGWRVFVIWECETFNELLLNEKLLKFLQDEK